MVANDNWLWRGFQSAVFYYVSCGPCFTQAALRKRRKEGKAAQRQRAAMEDEDPYMHVQPAPFQINPHWKEEMVLGPGPPSRRKNRTGTPASRGITTAGTANTDSTAGSSLSDLGPVQSMSSVHLAGHSWNSKRYQRADEEFAYFPPLEEVEDRPHTRRQMSSQGSSVGVSGWSAEPVEKPESAYYIPARAPPVNDLHPPVVSTVPAKKNERAWMMEPPPSASFMNGKKGVTTRSRSGSGNSGNSSLKNTDPSLGRQVGYKMVEDKVKRGATPLPDEGEPSTANRKSTATMATGRSSPMKGRGSSSLDVDDPERTPSRRKKRPPPVQIPIFDSSSHIDDSTSSSPDVLRPTNKRNRPKSMAPPSKLHPSTTNRPALGTKSRSSENSMTRKSKDKSPVPASSSTLSPPEFSTAPKTPSPHRASSRRSGLMVNVGDGEMVDEYTPSPRKPKQRKDTKTDREEDSDYDNALYDEEQRDRSRNELLVKDSSLRTLQDQVEMRGLKGNKFIQSPVVEARVPLPKDALKADDLVLGERKRWSFDL